MRTFFIVYEENQAPDHPTGWDKINQFSTLSKAEKYCIAYENKHPSQFGQSAGPNRKYLLIESK